MFPFIASGFLFGIYLVILLVSKEYITFVLNIYFFLIGVVALFRAIQPILIKIRLPMLDKLRQRQFHITLSENKPPSGTTTVKDLMHVDFKFDFVDVGGLFILVVVVGRRVRTKPRGISIESLISVEIEKNVMINAVKKCARGKF